MSEVWRKSSYSADRECVEVAPGPQVGVRDSKLGADSPVLSFGRSAWRAFVSAIRGICENCAEGACSGCSGGSCQCPRCHR